MKISLALALWFGAQCVWAGDGLEMIAPSEGASVGGLILIAGTVSGGEGVGIQIDGGPFHLAQGTGPWTYSLDTKTLPDGVHTITARSNTAMRSIRVEVFNPVMSTIDLWPVQTAISAGQTIQFTATARDQRGNVMAGVVFTFTSSNPSIARIDGSGFATGVSAGGVDMKASAGALVSNVARLEITRNLLTNPGFEQGPANWVFPSSATVDLSASHSGMSSAKLHSPVYVSRFIRSSPRVAVSPGVIYKCAGWIKLSEVSKNRSIGGAKISASFYDSRGNLLLNMDVSHPLNGNAGWMNYAKDVAAPMGAVAAQLNLLFSNAKGTAWFDDLEITGPVPSPENRPAALPEREASSDELRQILGSDTTASNALSAVIVYPNPYKPGSGGRFDSTGISFDRLASNSVVGIYTLLGEKLIELKESGGRGIVIWDTQNGEGSPAASGVFFYRISEPGGDIRQGRLAIIR